ncbi:MAG: DNA polymerase [Methylocella sp.]
MLDNSLTRSKTNGSHSQVSLEEYFERLKARSFDPNERIEIDGKLRRAADVYQEGLHRRRQAKYGAKNRDAERARVAAWRTENSDKVTAWKDANSDKIKAQRNRAADRSYHRPFIAIDAEGQNFQGYNEIDKQGNVYPLHRTTLWGAGGWQRLYNSTELAAGIGLPALGKECSSYFLEAEQGEFIDPINIIEWLLELPNKYNRDNGFPHDVNFAAYSFNYDATQILLGFLRSKVWEITSKRSWKTKKRIKTATWVDEYAIDYLKSKWLKIWKLRDPDHPMKDKLDRNGDVKLKKNGKPEREIDAVAYICIEDAFGFYQKKFTGAIKPLVSQGYIEKKDYDEIEYMKEHRKEFDNLPAEEIKHYCNRELVCLSKALTVLRDGFDRMGIRLRTWTGAGSPAGALIRKYKLKETHYSPDIVVADKSMSPQQRQAHHAMIGGNIQAIQQGYAMSRELFLYDIVGAYPAAMMLLPSMREGTWKPHDEINPKQIEQDAIASNILSMFRVKWKFPMYSQKDKRGMPFFPFPYRTKRKSILFPNKGHAWIMRDELVAAFKWAKRFDCVEGITIEEWNEFIPGNDEKPYAFVAELYEMRRVAKTEKEYNIVEQAIKLALNSLYGKTVQSVGGDEENPPSCACPYYGAAITANCRARLMEAAIIDPYSIVAFMTDGIVATRELTGLLRAKEVFESVPPEGTIMNLGDWEFERMAGGFFLTERRLLYCS